MKTGVALEGTSNVQSAAVSAKNSLGVVATNLNSGKKVIPTLVAKAPVSGSIVSQRPVEVDWVRSHGRVRVIPDIQQRSPIIWVKRKSRLQDLNLVDTDSTVASSSFEDKGKVLDRPVIIEDRIPRSLTVGGAK